MRMLLNETGYVFEYLFNSSNEAEIPIDGYKRHTTTNILGCIITLVIALISVLGNLAVVIVSFWSETLRVQIGNMLIVYLSVTDILTGVFVMIPSAISVAYDEWPLGTVMCKIHAALNYWFACSSSFNLSVISFDRTLAVLYPFKYKTMMTPKIMMMFCGSIFFLSSVIGIACGVPNWNSYNYYEGVCALDYTTSIGVYYLFNSGCFFCYYAPAIIVGICNTLIILAANKSGKSSKILFVRRSMTNKVLQENHKDYHMRKTIKSMIVVVVTYYICFSPYAISKQIKVALGTDMPPWFNYVTTILIFVASAVNPFIYGILRKDYRDAFKRLPSLLIKKF